MRVRIDYTKNHLSVIIGLFRPLLKERKGDFMAKQTNSLAHTKWMCKYHIVFTPKYRRKIVYTQYKADLRDILKQLCSYKGGNPGRESYAGPRTHAGKQHLLRK